MPKADRGQSRSSSTGSTGGRAAEKGKQKAPAAPPASTSTSTSTAKPLRIGAYTLLPLRCPPAPAVVSAAPSTSTAAATLAKLGAIHCLFLRPDTKSKTQTAAAAHAHAHAGRALFVANLPTDATERHLRTLFKNAGAIERIDFQHGSTVPLSGQHILDALEAGQADGMDMSDTNNDADDDDDDDDLMGGSAEAVAAAAARNEAALAAQLQEERMGNSTRANGSNNKKKKKRRASEPEQEPAPAVQHLPPLDARELHGARALLPTCTSAHIVFLDASSLARALAQAESTSAAFVAAGGRQCFETPAPPKPSILAPAFKAARTWPTDPFAPSAPGPAHPGLPHPVGNLLPPPPPPPALGLAALLASYDAHRPPLERIKAFADSRTALHLFLRAHPDRDPLALAAAAAAAARPRGIQAVRVGAEGELLDADGFTIVTAGGKYGRSAEAGSKDARSGEGGASVRVARNRPHMASAAAYEAATGGPPRKKSKSKDLEDFYRFQTREKNREKLAQLRAKFQEDKLKVAKLKESRKFKPY